MESETATKNPILEMMARRDRERKVVHERNQKAREEKSQLEGVDYFDSVFDKKVLEVGKNLNELEPSSDSTEIRDGLESIAKDLQELQRYFTSSTIFLNDHKIQRCQNIINQLVTKSDETRARLVPKKKFGFKNKSATIQPKAEAKVDDINKIAHKEFLWTETQKRNALIRLESDKINKQDITLKDIENCVIIIEGHPGSLQMTELKNCLVLCGPVSRSIFADFCEKCTFALSCQQLRLHSSSSCDVYMFVTSRAIIEDCKDIRVAPNTYTYDGQGDDLCESGLDGSVNNWESIGDFNWLSTDMQSPNWSRINNNQKINDWEEFIENFKTGHQIS